MRPSLGQTRLLVYCGGRLPPLWTRKCCCARPTWARARATPPPPHAPRCLRRRGGHPRRSHSSDPLRGRGGDHAGDPRSDDSGPPSAEHRQAPRGARDPPGVAQQVADPGGRGQRRQAWAALEGQPRARAGPPRSVRARSVHQGRHRPHLRVRDDGPGGSAAPGRHDDRLPRHAPRQGRRARAHGVRPARAGRGGDGLQRAHPALQPHQGRTEAARPDHPRGGPDRPAHGALAADCWSGRGGPDRPRGRSAARLRPRHRRAPDRAGQCARRRTLPAAGPRPRAAQRQPGRQPRAGRARRWQGPRPLASARRLEGAGLDRRAHRPHALRGQGRRAGPVPRGQGRAGRPDRPGATRGRAPRCRRPHRRADHLGHAPRGLPRQGRSRRRSAHPEPRPARGQRRVLRGLLRELEHHAALARVLDDRARPGDHRCGQQPHAPRRPRRDPGGGLRGRGLRDDRGHERQAHERPVVRSGPGLRPLRLAPDGPGAHRARDPAADPRLARRGQRRAGLRVVSPLRCAPPVRAARGVGAQLLRGR